MLRCSNEVKNVDEDLSQRILDAESKKGKAKRKQKQTFDAVLNGSFDYEEEEENFFRPFFPTSFTVL